MDQGPTEHLNRASLEMSGSTRGRIRSDWLLEDGG